MTDTRSTAPSRDAWARASQTAAELHAEWGAAVPLTYFVVWLAGGFVLALLIGWITAPYAVWRAAGGTLQIFGVLLIALHLMNRKRAGQSRLQQLARELGMLWRNVVSRDPVSPPVAAAATETDSTALRARLASLEAAVLELGKELDAQYVGPLSGLKPPRPAAEKMSAEQAAAADLRSTRIQLQWVGFGWILIGLVLATWS